MNLNVRNGIKCAMEDCENQASIAVGTRFFCFDCMEKAKKEYFIKQIERYNPELIIEEAARIIKQKKDGHKNLP